MGFQALFKFVKCWRAPDIARETVPSSWGCDGDRVLAEFLQPIWIWCSSVKGQLNFGSGCGWLWCQN